MRLRFSQPGFLKETCPIVPSHSTVAESKWYFMLHTPCELIYSKSHNHLCSVEGLNLATIYWLVVWNILYFLIYWESSSQLTLFRGVETNHQPVSFRDRHAKDIIRHWLERAAFPFCLHLLTSPQVRRFGRVEKVGLPPGRGDDTFLMVVVFPPGKCIKASTFEKCSKLSLQWIL